VRTAVLLLSGLLALTACSGSSTPATAPSSPASPTASEPAGPNVLPVGKSDLVVTGTYLSPDGFVPPLALQVPAGWHSTHRGDDAFDLTRPGVTVSLVTPIDQAVATALASARKAATGTVTPVKGTLDGQPATGFVVTGGTGRLVASPSGTLTVDAVPGGRIEVLGTDVEGVPLLAVTSVTDAKRWTGLHAQATALLAGVAPG
jgi:hypothetical protein